jgi:hypothetical protein
MSAPMTDVEAHLALVDLLNASLQAERASHAREVREIDRFQDAHYPKERIRPKEGDVGWERVPDFDWPYIKACANREIKLGPYTFCYYPWHQEWAFKVFHSNVEEHLPLEKIKAILKLHYKPTGVSAPEWGMRTAAQCLAINLIRDHFKGEKGGKVKAEAVIALLDLAKEEE